MDNNLLRWEPLVPGDVVDVVAPASGSSMEVFSRGIEYLRSIGLSPRYSADLIKPDLYFASSLESQWEQFKEALHSDSKIIWCLRGGYGSMRLIPLLEGIPKPQRTKLLVGFSDITSLHLYLNQKWGWPTLHGRTISQLNPDWEMNQEQRIYLDVLFGKQDEVIYSDLIPLNSHAREELSISGSIIGGNLRLIQSSLGTANEIKSSHQKILFIEDVLERGYSVDRMLEQLLQASRLKEFSAILIGDFTQGFERNGLDLTPEAFRRFARLLPIPVMAGLPCGHFKERNFPLPLNTKVFLKLGEKPVLTCRVNN